MDWVVATRFGASISRSSTSRAVAWMRSPSRNFWLRGNFSTAGTSHSRKRYIASGAEPVARAVGHAGVDRTGFARGLRPLDPQG